jgi:hypothetical protein
MNNKIKAVYLPTEDESHIHAQSGVLIFSEKATKYGFEPQHLYITVSQDIEPIKEGDWVVQTRSDFIGIKEIARVTKVKYNKKVRTDLSHITTTFDPTESFRSDNDWCRKIIATTDPKLTSFACNQEYGMCAESCQGTCNSVKKLQQSFIKEYVVNPDGEFEVEYEYGFSLKMRRGNTEHAYKLKLNQDNEVDITSVKERGITITSVEEKMYSRDEVESLILSVVKDISYGDDELICHYNGDFKDAKNWIKENL